MISGGDGNDTITGGDGADSLDGGIGDDTFVQTISQFNGDADTITGGTGTNTLNLSTTAAVTIADVGFNGRMSGITNVTVSDDTSDTVTWTLGSYSQTAGVTTVTVGATTVGVIDATSYGVAITLAGNAGADTLTGSSFNDTITGGAGADSITGNAGNDNINGGAGLNVIDAGSGDDTVTITDAADADNVVLGTGNDTLVGGAAVTAGDTLTGGTGTDLLTLAGGATAGNVVATTITFDGDFTGFEQITVGAGLTATAVANANDTAGSVNDYTLALADANVAAATTFIVDASALRTTITTALGTDNEIGGTAGNADTTTGEENLSLDASGLTGTRAVSVLGGAGADTILGGAGADTITGNAGADSLVGNGGSDVISGGDGADTVTGGAAADTITLGAGADVVIIDSVANSTGTTFDSITDFVTGTDKINITLTTGDFSFDVSGFAVVSNFNDGIVSLSTSRGDSFYSTADGKLYVDDNASGSINASLDHVVSISTLAATDINFSITGGGNANTIVGGSGADTIDGAGGADVITGGAGDDNITGGTGTDTITGGTGADTISAVTSGDRVVQSSGDSLVATVVSGTTVLTGIDVITASATIADTLVIDLSNMGNTIANVGVAALTFGATVMAGTTVNQILIMEGTYTGGVFTAVADGTGGNTHTLIQVDTNGATAGGIENILIVGVFDATASSITGEILTLVV